MKLSTLLLVDIIFLAVQCIPPCSTESTRQPSKLIHSNTLSFSSIEQFYSIFSLLCTAAPHPTTPLTAPCNRLNCIEDERKALWRRLWTTLNERKRVYGGMKGRGAKSETNLSIRWKSWRRRCDEARYRMGVFRWDRFKNPKQHRAAAQRHWNEFNY